MAHPQWMQGCEDVSYTRMDKKIRTCLDFKHWNINMWYQYHCKYIFKQCLKICKYIYPTNKTPVQGKKMQTLESTSQKIEQKLFHKTVHFMYHYNTIIKFTLYMHLQSCGRTLWNNNTCTIQHINSCSRTAWILIDSRS